MRRFAVCLRRYLIVVVAVFVVPGAAIAAPVQPAAPTPPANQRVTYTYKTFLDPTTDYWGIRSFDVDFGTITLTFKPDKTIRGTYRADSSPPTTVWGHVVAGGKLSLQIKARHLIGHFTRRGFVVSTQSAGSHWTLWAQFMR
jgi:hypothetical protein